jgi:hypothetical protein
MFMVSGEQRVNSNDHRGVDGAKPSVMTKIKNILIGTYIYIYSLTAVIPVFALPAVLATTSATTTSIVEMAPVTTLEVKEIDTRAARIDAYFARYNLPLTGSGADFIETADRYNLDWRLLPAIAMRESTGGKFSCPYGNKNVFGWASCKVKFSTYESAIDKVGQHLSGNATSTKGYYGNKTTYQKLRKYNSVINNYPKEVLAIMDKIEDTDIYSDVALR